MDCVIIAGGLPGPKDPLYALSQGGSKVLIKVAGRPMLEWVVNAMQGSPHVDDIVIVGLGEKGDAAGLQTQRPVHHLPDHGGLVENAAGGVRWLRQRHPDKQQVLLCSGDLAALTAEVVDHFVAACSPFDHALYYNFVRQETMEARYPGSQRTFVPLRGVRIAGGDLFLADPVLAESHQDLWRALANGRKHAWQLAWTIGPRVLLRFLLRRLTIPEMEALAGRILQRPVKIIINPHAEVAMDVDKPHHIEVLEADWKKTVRYRPPAISDQPSAVSDQAPADS